MIETMTPMVMFGCVSAFSMSSYSNRKQGFSLNETWKTETFLYGINGMTYINLSLVCAQERQISNLVKNIKDGFLQYYKLNN